MALCEGTDGESRCARWWRREGAAVAAEVAGTAALVAIGCMSVRGPGDAPPLTHPALAWGGAVAALVAALGPVSGAHFNPAVTLAALLYRLVSVRRALLYVAAQVIGATVGFAALIALTGGVAGCTAPGPGVSASQVAGVEALLTFLLVLVASSAWAAAARGSHSDATPLVLGATVAALVFAGGPVSGASLNPARSLGPALLLNQWEAHWAYWLGPLLGATLAGLLHRLLSAPPPLVAPPPVPLLACKTNEPDV